MYKKQNLYHIKIEKNRLYNCGETHSKSMSVKQSELSNLPPSRTIHTAFIVKPECNELIQLFTTYVSMYF